MVLEGSGDALTVSIHGAMGVYMVLEGIRGEPHQPYMTYGDMYIAIWGECRCVYSKYT